MGDSKVVNFGGFVGGLNDAIAGVNGMSKLK